MKKLYISLSLMFVSLVAFSQWTIQESGTTNSLYSVFFVDANIGYTVGSNGIILKTTNSGNKWSVQSSMTSNILHSVYFADNTTGYAVGDNGTIIKTIDSGINWTAQVSGTSWPLYSVFFTDVNNGFAVGGSGTAIILKTTNGGSNWISQPNRSLSTLYSVCFFNASTGYSVGVAVNYTYLYGAILITNNSGNSWSYLGFGRNQDFFSVCLTDINTAYAVGSYHLIMKTTDGGTNWTDQTSAIVGTLSSVFFTDNITGYIVGGDYWSFGKIQKTTNAGTNWNSQTSGTTHPLNSVYFTNVNIGFAVGDSGTILKTINGGDRINEISDKTGDICICPNPTTNKITIINNEEPQKTKINIFNIQGELVLSKTFYSQNSMEIDVSYLAKGTYFVKIHTEKTSTTKKLVIQ